MKSIVVYDTNYGNTKKLAETIASKLGKDARAVQVSDVHPEDLEGIDLLIVGSPIIAWGPSPKIKKFLSGLEKNSLNGKSAAVFDTRINIKIHGDAFKKISKTLQKAGAKIIVDPEFFFVKDKEGPLVVGQLEKAAAWVSAIKAKMAQE